MKEVIHVLQLLTVEDEPWISKGIEKMLPWHQYDIQLIGHAKNGEMALDLMKLNKPDIIITDIKMPVMDGLSMIERLSGDVAFDSKVIIISGYNDFEYAKKAIKYGVSNFILKPIDPEELKSTIESVVSQIHKEKREQENVSSIRLKNYMYERITHQEKPADDEIVFPKKYYCFIFSLTEIPEAEMKQSGYSFSLRMGRQIVYVVFGDTPEGLTKLARTTVTNLHDRYACGMSQVHTSDDLSVEKAYKEAIQDMKYGSGEENRKPSPTYLTVEDESRLLSALKKGEKKLFTQQLNELLDRDQTLEAHLFILFQLYVEISKYFRVYNELNDNVSWLLEWKTVSAWGDLYRWKATFFNPLIEFILNRWDKQSKDYALQAKIFVEQHYGNSSLSLDMVAEYLELSPSYLSLLFKNETGINFTSYIAKKRIKEAQTLLARTKLNLIEISRAVGFNDVKYFIKVFKKELSLTPIQYREIHR